ncbi:MAG: hypothetical protein IH597_08810 [Bacteroidales bacterium]|nr:hypothetical protein [Bacteroidales bacterium]
MPPEEDYYYDTESNLWLNNNRNFSSFLLNNYFKIDYESIDDFEIIYRFQNEVHNLLYRFINGRFPENYWTGKVSINLSALKKIVLTLQKRISGNPLLFKGQIATVPEMYFYPVKIVAGILSEAYILLESLIPINQTSIIVNDVKSLENWRLNSIPEDHNYLKPVFRLSEFIKNFRHLINSFFIHGSVATHEYIKNYSDLDTLVIIKSETVKNFEAILELREYIIKTNICLFQIDSLMHHGIMCFSEIDTRFYPETYFPLLIFDYSICIYSNSDSMIFYPRDVRKDTYAMLAQFYEYFSNQHFKYNYNTNAFYSKNYLQNLLILPCLYYQAMNQRYIYKKDSFEEVSKTFSSEAWLPISEASWIRLLYKNKPLLSFFFNLMLNKVVSYKLLLSLEKKLKKDLTCFQNFQGNNFKKSGFELVQKMILNLVEHV